MSAERDAGEALPRLRRAFEELVALERLSRACEGLVIGASCAWVLGGLARLEGERAAQAALVPSALAGLLAAASWWIERWRSRAEIAARADRVLSQPQLIETALEASGWSELLARRAWAAFERARLWRAAAPAWAASAALVLLAAGAREFLVRMAPTASAPSALVAAWNTLADELDSGSTNAGAPERAELAARVREAAAREADSELRPEEARALLARSAELFGPSAAAGTPASGRSGSPIRDALAQAYSRPPAAPGAGSGAAAAGTPSSGAGSGVPSAAGEGTMAGSTESGQTPIPAPASSAGAGAVGAVRPTLSARWWPRDQDGLVAAWIERTQRNGSKR